MNGHKKLAEREGFAGEADRRKRLGQYFTGVPLGRLLAALADANEAKSILDPMAGRGDLLQACLDVGATPDILGAIEIDPAAHAASKEALASGCHILGSSFSDETISGFSIAQWDLVITNPPYVRYQSLSKSAGLEFPLPSASEIREGLIRVLDRSTALDEQDRQLFKALAAGYSGLADLAVPSWLLCAALVRPGGRLALVVPDSWLSRDYAAVIHYLLARWFRIEHLVEDEHAVWFPDAQVKTTLLVAQRIARRESAFAARDDEFYQKIRISRHASGPSGPIDRLYRDSANKDRHFAAALQAGEPPRDGSWTGLVEAFKVPQSRFSENLRAQCEKQRWFAEMGEGAGVEAPAGYALPHELACWLETGSDISLTSLEQYGIQIGQGLRTGANSFFYADVAKHGQETASIGLVWQSAGFRSEGTVPAERALPVLRRQAELPQAFCIDPSSLCGRVVALQGLALPEDIETSGAAGSFLVPMPPELAKVVREAGLANFGTPDAPKRIHELTAVAPNIRKGNEARGVAPRFWYMLPDFAPRHRPDLVIARVNSGRPKAYLNIARAALVDANFSTLWRDDNAVLAPNAVLALLNSTWCWAALELMAAVMGGGALKVEATHLRRMPIPRLSATQREQLSMLGEELAFGADQAKTLRDIDRTVATALLGRIVTEAEIDSLSQLARTSLSRRTSH